VISSLPRSRIPVAIVRRDFHVQRSYRLPFLLEVFYGVLELAVYYFISRTFAGSATPDDLQGAPSYFAFAAVGLILAVVVSATTSGIGYTLREEQTAGTLEMLDVHPVTTTEICAGLVGFPFLFAIARAVLYLVVAGAFMDLDFSQTSWPGLALSLLASAAGLAPFGVLAGALVLALKRGAMLSGLIVYGMTLISGSVFPISVLPEWLQPLGKAMPTRFAFDGTRAALFEGTGWEGDVLALAAWGIVLLPVSLFAFEHALRYAKREGSLSQY
jgi:ABC-type transport system involved in cytochrome c biogenesis permease component